MPEVTIVQIQAAPDDAYDEYLRTHPHSLFYSSAKYRRFLTDLLECEDETLLALEGETIRGVLPLLKMRGARGAVFNSLPYFGSNGGILADNREISDALARAYNDIATSESTLASTVVDHPFQGQGCAGLRHNLTDSRISQYTPISIQSNHQDELLARIDASARRNVKKALREGVRVERDEAQFERLREMHQDNMRAIGGTAKSASFFALAPRYFSPGKDFDLYVARRDGEVIAALLVFYFNQTVEYFTPAIDNAFRSLQPLSLILLEAMTDAARRGLTWWNWGGTWTSQSGVYRFKAKWAASEGRYTYRVQLNDETLLECSAPEILEMYPNFFVVPFSALHDRAEADG